jgi:hypothetical protein
VIGLNQLETRRSQDSRLLLEKPGIWGGRISLCKWQRCSEGLLSSNKKVESLSRKVERSRSEPLSSSNKVEQPPLKLLSSSKKVHQSSKKVYLSSMEAESPSKKLELPSKKLNGWNLELE